MRFASYPQDRPYPHSVQALAINVYAYFYYFLTEFWQMSKLIFWLFH